MTDFFESRALLPTILVVVGIITYLVLFTKNRPKIEDSNAQNTATFIVNTIVEIFNPKNIMTNRIAIVPIIFLLIGFILFTYIGIGNFINGNVPSQGQTPIICAPRLMKLGYMYGNWDPKYVDLTTSSTDGIPVAAGYSLQFHYLYIDVPSSIENGYIDISFLANGIEIGNISKYKLAKDEKYIEFDSSMVNVFGKYLYVEKDAPAFNGWEIQPEWEVFTIKVITKQGEKAISTTTTDIRINIEGDSWYIPPSYASVLSLEYQIDNGEKQLLAIKDLEQGIKIQNEAGLSITNIWFKPITDEGHFDQEFRLSTYLTKIDGKNNYIEDEGRFAKSAIPKIGIQSFILLEQLKWKTIPNTYDSLVVYFYKDDINSDRAIILDKLEIPLIHQN